MKLQAPSTDNLKLREELKKANSGMQQLQKQVTDMSSQNAQMIKNVKNIMARARSASPVSSDKLRKKAQSVHKPVYQDVF